MKIVGHRGAAGLALENTLQSIAAAMSAGVDAVEFDIRLTKDHQFVLCHDASTERISDTTMVIAKHTLAELKNITLKNGERIATLQEAIRTAGSTPLIIEVKGKGWSSALSKFYLDNKVTNSWVISFNHAELAKFKLLQQNVSVAGIEQTKPVEILQTAARYNFDGIDLDYRILNPFTYFFARRRRLKIFTYTVNSVLVARFLSLFFPQIYITTNHPDKMQFLRKHGPEKTE